MAAAAARGAAARGAAGIVYAVDRDERESMTTGDASKKLRSRREGGQLAYKGTHTGARANRQTDRQTVVCLCLCRQQQLPPIR